MPTSFHAVFVVLLFLIPGFIARGALSSIYPSSEPSEAGLVLTAIALSCINYGLWSWLLVLAWKSGWYDHAVPLALLAALVLFLSPVLFTLAAGRFMRTNAFRRLREILGIRHPTPKSWDYFFGKGLPCWVICYTEKWSDHRRILRHEFFRFIVSC